MTLRSTGGPVGGSGKEGSAKITEEESIDRSPVSETLGGGGKIVKNLKTQTGKKSVG